MQAFPESSAHKGGDTLKKLLKSEGEDADVSVVSEAFGTCCVLGGIFCTLLFSFEKFVTPLRVFLCARSRFQRWTRGR